WRTSLTTWLMRVENGAAVNPTMTSSAWPSGERSSGASAGSVADDWTVLTSDASAGDRRYATIRPMAASSPGVIGEWRENTKIPEFRVGSFGYSRRNSRSACWEGDDPGRNEVSSCTPTLVNDGAVNPTTTAIAIDAATTHAAYRSESLARRANIRLPLLVGRRR